MTAVIIPTRNRPGNIVELLDAWAETIDMPNIAQAVIVVDGVEDQPADVLDAYAAIELPSWATMHFQPRRRLVPTLNHWAPRYVDDHTLVGFMGDDHRPRTKGWAERAIEAWIDGAQVIYADDGFQHADLPTSVFIDADVVGALGFFAPPTLVHLFCDNYWKALGEAMGTLRYLPDVLIEHMHPQAGKAANDAGYDEANSALRWEHDHAAFHVWDVDADAAIVAKALR
jgi:glycosyltransferase involved in cell wall biosynthesis